MNPYWSILLGCLFLSGAVAADGPLGVGDRLLPPQQVKVPDLPRVSLPTAPTAPAINRTPGRMWPLPTVALPREAARLPAELKRAPALHPALDAPPIAAETVPTGPRTIVLPETARTFVASANPDRPAPVGRLGRDLEPPTKATDDPSSLATHSFLVRPQLVVAPKPPPLLRLSIPDPDAALEAVRIQSAVPAEGESLSVPRDLPPRPTLPVK